MAKKKRKSAKNPDPQEPFSLPEDVPPLFGGRGMESIMRQVLPGLFGPGDTALEQAQDLLDQAFEAHSREERIALARHALDICADCADAYVLLADEAPTVDEALRLCAQGVAAGERAIGKKNFKKWAGQFWGIMETRPYMRARLGLARWLSEAGQRAQAVEHYGEMLRLNPDDNQGIRYVLLSTLLDLDHDDEARRLLAEYKDDASAEWAYTAALLAYRQEGDAPRARELLAAAMETNKDVPAFLVGNKSLPPEPPEYISPGEQSEAINYVGQFLRNWRDTEGAIPWLRKVLKVPLATPAKLRKPAWSQFRHAFLRLPQEAGEVWQLDLHEFTLATEKSPRAWAIVLVKGAEEPPLALELEETKPAAGQVWDTLIEAMLRPRDGEPHRPEQIEVRRKTFWTAWRPKLEQIGVSCVLRDDLPVLDGLLQGIMPTPEAIRSILDAGDDAAPADPAELAEFPQEAGETWQADVRRLPSWIEHEGEVRRPWSAIVTNRDEGLILVHDIAAEEPAADWLWKIIGRAVRQPMAGQPHRPGIVEVGNEEHHRTLAAPLSAAGVQCVVAEQLDHINQVFEDLAEHFGQEGSPPAMTGVPGVGPEQAGGFFAAADEFYRAAPWRRVPGDMPIQIDCDKFQTKTWYAVVMGQSGMVLGLALYEERETLRAILTGGESDEDNFRRTTGFSVMFGEAFELPIADLDAVEKHGWPVAGPEAYPQPFRVNPGQSVRPPLAWELELLEGALRAVTRFVAGKEASQSLTVPVASGKLTLRLSRVEDL